MPTRRPQQDGDARSDREIHDDVLDELEWDPRIRSSDLGASVKHGVVTLTGWVESFGQRWAAEEAAHRVPGVIAVANEIEVRLPITSERTDTEIAVAVARALAGNSALNADDIEVTVSDGVVVLGGVVAWEYQKREAEDAVRELWGVRAVTSSIDVRERRGTSA